MAACQNGERGCTTNTELRQVVRDVIVCAAASVGAGLLEAVAVH